MSANPTDLLFAAYIQDYGRGRVCGHDGCGTILSRYNPTLYCVTHETAHWDDLEPLEPINTKVCPVCREELPRAPFYFAPDGSNKDGYKYVCRPCLRERARQRYATDPDYRTKTMQAARASNARSRARKRGERQGATA